MNKSILIILTIFLLSCGKKSDGVMIQEYFPSGNIAAEWEELNGIRTGVYKEYYENGSLKFDGHFINEKKNGWWKRYRETGEISYLSEFILMYSEVDSLFQIINDIDDEKKISFENRRYVYHPNGEISDESFYYTFYSGLEGSSSIKSFKINDTIQARFVLEQPYFENGSTIFAVFYQKGDTNIYQPNKIYGNTIVYESISPNTKGKYEINGILFETENETHKRVEYRIHEFIDIE